MSSLINRVGAAQELNRLAISLAIMYSLQCLGVHRIERPISLCYLQLFYEDNCREFEVLQPGSVLAPRFKVTKLWNQKSINSIPRQHRVEHVLQVSALSFQPTRSSACGQNDRQTDELLYASWLRPPRHNEGQTDELLYASWLRPPRHNDCSLVIETT